LMFMAPAPLLVYLPSSQTPRFVSVSEAAHRPLVKVMGTLVKSSPVQITAQLI
jgi:hypothetical protein